MIEFTIEFWYYITNALTKKEDLYGKKRRKQRISNIKMLCL